MRGVHRATRRALAAEVLAVVDQLAVDVRNLRDDVAEVRRQLDYVQRLLLPKPPPPSIPRPTAPRRRTTSWAETEPLPKVQSIVPVLTLAERGATDPATWQPPIGGAQ